MAIGMILLLLVLVIAAIAGMTGKSAGLGAGIAGLGLVGLLLVAGIFYFFLSMPAAHHAPRAVMLAAPNSSMSINWNDDAYGAMPPEASQVKASVSFFGLLLLSGAAIALMYAFFRRSGSTSVPGHHRGWWPAALLLLLLPLVFFIGTVHVRKSVSYSNRYDAEMHAQQMHQRVARQQVDLERRQAEIAQRTSELSTELQHRLDNMEIHKLMDLVDAPRIMLPIPTPATIAMWANAAASAAVTGDEPAENVAQVQAEADAAVKLIAADGEAASAAGSTAASDTDDGRGRGRPGSRYDATDEPRPDWVQKTPKRVGNVRRDVVATDEYATVDECYWAADRLLQLKTYEHIQRLLGMPYDSNGTYGLLSVEGHSPRFLTQLKNAGITVDYIQREIAKDEYLETVERSFGPMRKLYTLIEFSPAFDSELRQRWEASQRQERFAFVGLGASSVLGLLGLAWGLLKIDTWTKGYYTKRLFIAVPLAIVGALGLYAMLL